MKTLLATTTPSHSHLNFPSFCTASDSTLGRIIAASTWQSATPEWVKPTFEVIRRTEYTPGPPRYSTDFLQRAHLTLLERELGYATAIQKALATSSRPDLFGADQSILAHRVTSMTALTAKLLGLMPSEFCPLA